MQQLILSILVLAFSFRTAYGVKCFACSSTDNAVTMSKPSDIAYSVKKCDDANCTTRSVKTTFTVAQFYQANLCGNSIDVPTQAKLQQNVVDCEIGCVKVVSNAADRSDTVNGRITRECAYNDKSIQYSWGGAGTKRTGSGSDKVNNLFFYCNTDNCNGSSNVSPFGVLIFGAVFANLVAMLS